MKKIILAVLATAVLVGCASQPKGDGFDPKFGFAEKVTFTKGWFKGRTGLVTGFSRCKEDGQGTLKTDVVCYDVQVMTEFGPQGMSNVPERELLAQ